MLFRSAVLIDRQEVKLPIFATYTGTIHKSNDLGQIKVKLFEINGEDSILWVQNPETEN